MRNIRLRNNRNISYIFQPISKYAKCYNSMIIKFFIYIIFSAGLLLTGCVKTEGTLEIKGMVMDDYTKKEIPWRKIIIQGLIESNEKFIPIDAGHFSTDSLGCFTYSLRKVKDAHSYNFCFVGDSDYLSVTRNLNLYELKQNAKYLSFSLTRLVDLTIKIYRENKNPVFDTLSLFWESNGVSCWSLNPYKIYNYGKTNKYFSLTSGIELRWIGGNVNSTVKTKVFADKRTKLYWGLDRNGKRSEIIDTITCKRDFANIVYFTY
jgi:hypothetical protein